MAHETQKAAATVALLPVERCRATRRSLVRLLSRCSSANEAEPVIAEILEKRCEFLESLGLADQELECELEAHARAAWAAFTQVVARRYGTFEEGVA